MGVRQIGARVQRVEDDNLIRGNGKYLDDIQLPNMTHAAFLRSSMAHANISITDISQAQELPVFMLYLPMILCLLVLQVKRNYRPIQRL